MASTTRAGDDVPPRRRRSPVGALLGFLVGVVVTTVVAVVLLGIGVAGVGDAEEAMAPTPTPTPTADPTPRQEGASGPVPAACLEAAEYNQTLNEALDEIAVGVRDQDARTLQEALDAVQDARPGSEAASQECQDLAGTDGATDDATAGTTDEETAGTTDEETAGTTDEETTSGAGTTDESTSSTSDATVEPTDSSTR